MNVKIGDINKKFPRDNKAEHTIDPNGNTICLESVVKCTEGRFKVLYLLINIG